MTGNTPVLPQVLGASTIAGVAAVALPSTGSNRIFASILVGVIVIAVLVVATRLIKTFVKRNN